MDRPPRNHIALSPGNRSDVLVKAPEKGDYLLYDLPSTAAEALRKSNDEPGRALARIVVRGAANDMSLPDPAALRPYAPYSEIKTVQKQRKLDFDGGGNAWTIDAGAGAKQFDPDRVDECPVVGTAEEWTLHSTTDNHAFHIHVNPLQVRSIKDSKNNELLVSGPVWKDTILLQEGYTIVFRTRFEDFAGKSVLHCHKLDHEDQGMMQMFRILPKCPEWKSSSASVAVDGASRIVRNAPDWKLPDATGKFHELRDFAGRPLIIVFYRGVGCLHCVEQLRAFAERREGLELAGVKLVAIGSDSRHRLGESLDGYAKGTEIPFLFLADEDHIVFKRYGCFEGRPMHGVFLINNSGQVRWEKITETPVLDVDQIVTLSRRLRTE